MRTILFLGFFTSFIFSIPKALNAQEKKYQFTAAVGAGQSYGLDNLKSPGYTIKLYAEKFLSDDETKTFWLAFDYLRQNPHPSVTQPDESDSTVTATTIFHKATVMTLTFGGRKFFSNGLIVGGGFGVASFSQIYPTKVYSDGSRYYDQYEHAIGDIGIGHIFQIGYKPSRLQILAGVNGVWLPFRITTNSDYEIATPTYLPAVGLAMGYSF